MKAALLFAALFALALMVIPMLAIGFESGLPDPSAQIHIPSPSADTVSAQDQSYPDLPEPQNDSIQTSVPEEPSTSSSIYSSYGVDAFSVLDESTGEVVTVPLREYVQGAVAAEMPVSFHSEALRAQAVAAHTWALYNHYAQLASPDPALQGADFSADPQNRQIYITEETARALYGENADLYWDKICEAVDSVLPYIMVYNEEPIVAAYHAMSAGHTEDASNVWQSEAPYLQPVESAGDLLAPDFETFTTLTSESVLDRLLTAWPSVQLPEDPQKWFSNIRRSDSGYIISVEIGGLQVHGKDLRTLLNLRSHNMDIEYISDTDSFQFIVYGYGHGVGLSQYGADFLARQGLDYKDILTTYYTGIELQEISPELF